MLLPALPDKGCLKVRTMSTTLAETRVVADKGGLLTETADLARREGYLQRYDCLKGHVSSLQKHN